MVQSLAEASPAKWHLAHTAWFFESFVLAEFLPCYRLFNRDFPWLFNSYYRSFSPFPEKRLRSSFSRPGLDEVLRYREHVDEAVERLLELNPEPEALRRIELGVNHEEQHQELLLTDILHAFFTNPLRPAYLCAPDPDSGTREGKQPVPLTLQEFPGGLREAGHSGESFCFDNELPRHRVWLEPYTLATRLVTCGEFAAFIADGGYHRPELWLSAGWDAVTSNGWHAPLYWTDRSGEGGSGAWSIFTLRGELSLVRLTTAPVSHVSYFEADAYARWAGRRLTTEFEWEAAAEGQPVSGNLLDSGRLLPVPAAEQVAKQHDPEGGGGFNPRIKPTEATPALVAEECFPSISPKISSLCAATEGPKNTAQFFGDCWEWTAGAYLGYPGFKPLAGSLGEYNGKFMNGQMVLRGGSCVTPAAHIRASYRNFFVPETRWQFSGIRLAS